MPTSDTVTTPDLTNLTDPFWGDITQELQEQLEDIQQEMWEDDITVRVSMNKTGVWAVFTGDPCYDLWHGSYVVDGVLWQTDSPGEVNELVNRLVSELQDLVYIGEWED
jgi:hypothetical protein